MGQERAQRPGVRFDNGMDVVDRPASALPDKVVADLVLPTDLRTQLSGVSFATTLEREASRESVLTAKLLTSIPCELVATSKSSAPSSSLVLRARASHFAHSAVSARENHSPRRARSSHWSQTSVRGRWRRSMRRSGRDPTARPAPRHERESEDARNDGGSARRAENRHRRHPRRIRSRHRRRQRGEPAVQCAIGAPPPRLTLRRLNASGTAASESSVNSQKTSM